MRRNYWTPKRDEELNRHKASGLSASKIATLLHTTRNAILGRSNRLRNRPSQAKIEQLKRQRIAAAEPRKKAAAEKREKAAAEAREKAQAHQDKILVAMRADLAAGVDRNVVIKRAIGAGAKSVTVAEFFGLSRRRVNKIAEPEKLLPQWTNKQVELLLSMWSGHHSAQEIADALGTSRGAVLGKIWRARKSKNSASSPGHCRPRALSGSGSRAATSIRS
jgi:hypothetical protein